MLRVSNHGGSGDALVKVIADSCYGESAQEVAQLFREMLQTYHMADEKLGNARAIALSEMVFAAMPTALKTNMVGTDTVYRITVKDKNYRLTWRELLAKGSYNHVYYCDLTTDGGTTTPAVIKVTTESDNDLRVYLLENVLHALLYQLPRTRDLVVPIRFPFKIRRSGFPEWTLGTVMDDPGRGNFGDFVEDHLKNDEQLFSLLTQLAWIIYRGQKAVALEHRDLKADNVMITSNDCATDQVHVPELNVRYHYPTLGIKAKLIDFGMARLELKGEYLACSVLHTRTQLNKCHDLQNFCCTLLEDYQDEMKQNGPRFYKWLRATCDPLFKKLYAEWPDYKEVSNSRKHERLSFICNREKHHAFAPHNMLKTLSLHWGSRLN